MQDDQQWIRQVQQGDPEGLRLIYEHYRDRMYTIALYLLVDPAGAEDCLHDVFLDLARGARGFRRYESLKGYLATCVANRARDYLRRNRRSGPVSLQAVEGSAAASDETAEQGLIEREELARLDMALRQLPYEQREVITLHAHGDMTFQDIARQQRTSINTTMSRHRYGMEKLRELLNANTGART